MDKISDLVSSKASKDKKIFCNNDKFLPEELLTILI